MDQLVGQLGPKLDWLTWFAVKPDWSTMTRWTQEIFFCVFAIILFVKIYLHEYV